jgi:hypothetical protein
MPARIALIHGKAVQRFSGSGALAGLPQWQRRDRFASMTEHQEFFS